MADLVGFTNTCAARSGGVKAIYLSTAANVTTFTDTTNVWTAVTMVSSKVFKKYEFEVDTAELRLEDTVENGSYMQKATIELNMPAIHAAQIATIKEFVNESPCGMIAIVELNTLVGAASEKIVIGYNLTSLKERPLKLESNTGTSGKLLTDLTGFTPLLSASSPVPYHTAVLTIPV